MPFCQVIVDINHTDVDHVFTYRVPKGLVRLPRHARTRAVRAAKAGGRRRGNGGRNATCRLSA